jgi:acylpyruvate hydrolase
MRLVSFRKDQGLVAGFEVDGRVVEASELAEARAAGARTVRQLLELGEEAIQRLAAAASSHLSDRQRPALQLEEVRLGPPVPDPDKIICVGQNYADHVAEMAGERPQVPNLFAKFRNGLVGSGEPIRLPRASQQVDFEGELAVVIGRRCRQVREQDALHFVAAYAALNDVSARDLQFRTGQYTMGKAIDTFCPMGPGLVLAADIPDPQRLGLTTYLNGEQMQAASTSSMLFSVAEVISFISEVITLECGDIIATGTPSGVGYKRTPPRFLRAGDRIEVEVEGVGRLSNPVIQG